MKAAALPLLVVCLVAATASIEARHSKDDRGSGHRDRDRNRSRDQDRDQGEHPTDGRITIENSGKIVNNGVRDGERQDLQKQDLLEQLGYTQTLEAPSDMETLQRQRFVLEVLMNVHGQLINDELQELGQNLVVDEHMYSGRLDDDMLDLLQLCINGQALRKGQTFHGLRPEHRRQLVGLYKLLVRASDWETFQRNACFARTHLNGVLFVNGLLLALRDRADTRDLAVPAINEILPELFYDEQLLQRVRGTDVRGLVSGSGTSKPHLKDVVGQGGWTGQQGWESQPKKTWQEWRQERLDRQAAMGQSKGERGAQASEGKLVIPVLVGGDVESGDLDERISYLTHDIGLNNFWYGVRVDSLLRMRSPHSHSGIAGTRGQGLMERDNAEVAIDGRQGSATKDGDKRRDEVRDTDRDNSGGAGPRFNPLLILNSIRNTANDVLSSRKVLDKDNSDRRRNNGPLAGLDIDVRKGLRTTSVDNERLLKIGRRNMEQELGDNDRITQRSQVGVDRLLRSGQRQRGISGRGDDSVEFQSGDRRTTTDRDNDVWTFSRRGQNGNENTNRIDEGSRNRIRSELSSMGVQRSLEDSRDGQRSTEESREGVVRGREDRLLKLSRRRMGQTSGSLWNERQQSSEESRKDLRRRLDETPLERRTTLDNDRLLKINRRRLNEIRRTTGVDSMEVSISRERSSEEDSYEQREGGMQNELTQGRTSMEDDRLVRLNRRRLDRNLGTSRDFDSGEIYSGRDRKGNYGDRSLEQDSRSSGSSAESSEETLGSQGDRLLKVGRRRLPRNVDTIRRRTDSGEDLAERRAGEIVVANMQQMVARINLERLSHQLEDVRIRGNGKNEKKSKVKRLGDNKDMRYAERLNQRSLENRSNRQALEQIQETERRLQDLVRAELDVLRAKGLVDLKNANIAELIGQILIGRISNTDRDIVLVWKQMSERMRDILGAGPSTRSLLANLALQLQDPIYRYLLERIVNIVRSETDRLPGYRSEDVQLAGVQLNDVKVDRLQTFFDSSDSDLINMLDQKELMRQQVDLKTFERLAVARQRRLNHKAFTLSFDVTADRNRRAVVRVFLGPKLDAVGNEISLNDRRGDFVLLDAFATDLVAGRNVVQRKSSDIAWTNADTTPLTQIYRQVLEAIDGARDLRLGPLVDNRNCRFPQRLLLPRGLPQGLPMQLFVIISGAPEDERSLGAGVLETGVCGMGIASVGLDTLPLGFPLDRNIYSDRDILLPNVILKDISIYHNDKLDSRDQTTKK